MMPPPSADSVGRLLCPTFCGAWSRFDMALEPLGSEANLTACVCSALSRRRPPPRAGGTQGERAYAPGCSNPTGLDWYWRIYLTLTFSRLAIEMPGIVVVTYNSADVIELCIDACRRLTEDTVVIVDNASVDETVREFVRFPVWG